MNYIQDSDNLLKFKLETVNIDFQEMAKLVGITSIQYTVDRGDSETTFPEHVECDDSNPDLSYFVENSRCYEDTTIFGDISLLKGSDYDLTVSLNECKENCEEFNQAK
jgi:hypothetical protein